MKKKKLYSHLITTTKYLRTTKINLKKGVDL